ncbi:hypothetical protein PRIPAC_88997 [Pristionchus pacificus]|uniref:Uncharacterized protein n=1 Tax=Pristionchus pacificus TaxID=54126 RepID=A0A2A6CVG3_PRIPA|nr:hypothetical protein PRIPAC_88997 [Pristionchus pacificus]|eukprot:PDM82149.1 hypothetical protein PRIPAC_36542 [Pristionchus pacificus]
MDNSLEFERLELLPKGVWICQVDKGTIFYWKYTNPKRLYVKRENNEISAQLPDGTIYCKGAYGNALYLCSETQLYKAAYDLTNGIVFTHLRAKLEDEVLHFGGFCTRFRDGKTYAYRMGEDPHRDGVQVNVSEQVLNNLELRLMHRGKLIFVSKNSEAVKPSVQKLKENVLVVEMRYEYSLYAREFSPFLYVSGGNTIFTLDTLTLEFLQPLTTDVHLHSIAGIYNAVLTVESTDGEDNQTTMVAPLPEEYIVNTITLNGETMTIEAFIGRYKDMEQLMKDVLDDNINYNGDNTKQDSENHAEMENTIAALTAQLAEFAQERKHILKANQEVKKKVESSAEELQQKIVDHAREMVEAQKSFDDYKTESESLVRSLKLENCVRVKEKEIMEAELYQTIGGLRNENDRLKRELDQMVNEEMDTEKLTSLIEQLQEKNIQLTDEINRNRRTKEHDSNKLVSDLRKVITELMHEKDRIRSLNEDDEDVEEDDYINELRNVIANLTKEDRGHEHVEQDDLPPPPPAVLAAQACRVSGYATGSAAPELVMQSPVPVDPVSSSIPAPANHSPQESRLVTSTASFTFDQPMSIAAVIREVIPSRRSAHHRESEEAEDEEDQNWED